MGISLNLISTIAETVEFQRLSGSLLMLGRQDIDGGQPPEDFFAGFGFSPVDSLDISSAEGASVIFDLNAAVTPPELMNRWDVLFDGGTLEHVFHVPNALARCTEMLKAGGAFVHIGPMNNYVDHGFYQFSPTFWFDWFGCNDWQIIESVMVRLPSHSEPTESGWSFSFLPPDRLGTVGQLDEAPYMHFFAAKKILGAVSDRVPTQTFYARRYGKEQSDQHQLREFEPYTVVKGRRVLISASDKSRQKWLNAARDFWNNRFLGGHASECPGTEAKKKS